jgi:hypothetical protein
MLSVLVIVPASQMVMFSERPDRGWTRWVPTSALIVAAGRFDFGPCLDKGGLGAWMHIALIRRQKHMWEWQRERWLHPMVVEAIREEWTAMRMREVWPEGITPTLAPSHRRAGSWPRSARIITPPTIWVPPWRGAPGARKAMASVGRKHNLPVSDIGKAGWARGEVIVNWSYVSARPPSDPLWIALGSALAEEVGAWSVSAGLSGTGSIVSGAMRLPQRPLAPALRTVKTMDEAIAPAPPELMLDGLVLRVPAYRLSPDPIDWPNASPSLVIDAGPPQQPPEGWPANVAYCFALVLRHGGSETVLTIDRNFPQSDALVGYGISFDARDAHVAFRAALARFAAGEPDAWEGWTLVITGDPLAALMETDAPMYWNGRIEVPFRPRR